MVAFLKCRLGPDLITNLKRPPSRFYGQEQRSQPEASAIISQEYDMTKASRRHMRSIADDPQLEDGQQYKPQIPYNTKRR